MKTHRACSDRMVLYLCHGEFQFLLHVVCWEVSLSPQDSGSSITVREKKEAASYVGVLSIITLIRLESTLHEACFLQ